ncbi:vanadium-dependent haloperoxidase [Micromonospora sp. C28ISP2-4]|uniref:vanadium-dependent haloperoxidase n=1 Tax=Micromonospora sp. C28ISP2-4 TaxID=3059523 RepID=UPI002676FC29|nr:vanadium-dependent haloperoxidase [Micromonospora sp. C28ISP2-4]MDO3683497.1 phosphatase PAP2 family protein [Micromonospora sp. C28ISP2-4]
MRRTPLRRLAALALSAVTLVGGLVAVQAPAAAVPAGFDHTIYWNNVLLKTYRAVGGPPTVLARAGAMMHLAMYDATASLSGSVGTPYLGKVARLPNWSYDLDMNVDMAAFKVLQSVFPGRDFTADWQGARTYPPIGEPGPEGWSTSVGEGTAQNMINARANDNSTVNTPYTLINAAGQWRPTEAGTSAAGPNWGRVKPFALTSSSQFRPSLPGGFPNITAMLTSTDYATQVNDVRRLGAATGSTRTADQTQAAFFWANDLDGTYKPPGQLFAHTQIIAKAKGTANTSKLFALVAMAMADASIAAWDAKYETDIDLWRPDTAIAEPQNDGNPDTVPQPAWEPLSTAADGTHFSPNFPAYISGHATFAGAWAGIMKRYYGTDAVTFTATTEDPKAVGVQRTFTSFSAAANENALSRLWLGVHYRWDADAGLATGDAVANRVFGNYLR